MIKHTNTFSKGINQDISTNKYSKENFYWAQNFRLVSKEGLSTGALTNIKGTSTKLDLGTGNNIVSTCQIRDTLVLFIASAEGGKIFIWENSDSDYEESPTLIYSDASLNFSTDKPVKAVGRYENENVQKIYFTDGDTFFKHLNIVHPTLGLGGVLDYDVDSLDLVSDIDFSTMSLELVPGGDLKTGKIQYAYQLYSVRGSESVFSPASQLIHLTNADESQNSIEYYGEEVGTPVNKSVNVTINSIDSLFTRLRLVALEYTVLYQQPEVRIVGEYNVENLTTITVADTGNSIGSLTIEEFLFVQNNFYPKSLDIKDDYLFAANIKNEYFEITDEEFDARAWRATSSDLIFVANDTSDTVTGIPHTGGVFDAATIPDVTTQQYNLTYNNLDYDFGANNKETTSTGLITKYIPGSVGTKLGGKGINIEYEFTIDSVVLDDSPISYSYGGKAYPKLSVGATSPFENNASPTAKVGYQRDEIYRFGIIFFDKKGRQSFTKWIGDIRFPSNRDSDDNYSTYAYITYGNNPGLETYEKTIANILGIKFTVNIPSEVQTKISGYQIVRAERTNSDKTIISQGLVGNPIKSSVGEDANYSMLYSQASPLLVEDIVNGYPLTSRAVVDYDSISYGDNFHFNSSGNGEIGYDIRWAEFDSPEVSINKTELPTSEAFIEVFGVQNQIETSAISGKRGYEEQGTAPDYDERDILFADKPRNFQVNTGSSKIRSFIDNCRVLQPKPRGTALEDSGGEYDAPKIIIENGQKYNNQGYAPAPAAESGARSKWGMRGTHALLTLDEVLPFDANWVDNSDKIQFPVANYKINRDRSIYGGVSYEARTATKYYPASEFQTVAPVPSQGEIPDITRQLITTSFTAKTAIVPGDICGAAETTVYCAYNKPEAGDVLYTDAGLTTNVTVPYVLLTDVAVYGNQILTVGYITGTVGGLSGYCCGDIFGTCADSEQYEIEVFNGDTYISYFIQGRTIYDVERAEGEKIEGYTFFPVESTINLALRLDKIQEYINWGFYRDSFIVDYKLVENTSMGVSIYGQNYPLDVGNLYRYNSAYSAIDKSKEYYPKPFDYNETEINDTRIQVSEKKINGEYTDNWTIFKLNNFLDVDSKHHAITKIITFKNNLFFVQPTGIGIASVNQRSLIQDNQPGQLALGTGGILTRYDYVTDKSGSAYYDAILTSDDFLFYADGRRKRINKIIPGKEVAVSLVKGIDSTLDKLAWDSVRAGFDKGYNEVIFAIDNTTIGFSEAADAFTSSYSYIPKLMFSFGGNFYSVTETIGETPWLYADLEIDQVGYSGEVDTDPDWDYILIGPEGSSDVLYKHDVSDPGDFYGDTGQDNDSYITLIINPAGDRICYFDNLDLRTESTLNGVDVNDDIFYRLEASNNYQDITRELAFLKDQTDPDKGYTYNTGSIKRIGRVWRTPIMATPASGSTNARIMDTYIKLTLRYSNTGNKFKVHDITSYIRPTNH